MQCTCESRTSAAAHNNTLGTFTCTSCYLGIYNLAVEVAENQRTAPPAVSDNTAAQLFACDCSLLLQCCSCDDNLSISGPLSGPNNNYMCTTPPPDSPTHTYWGSRPKTTGCELGSGVEGCPGYGVSGNCLSCLFSDDRSGDLLFCLGKRAPRGEGVCGHVTTDRPAGSKFGFAFRLFLPESYVPTLSPQGACGSLEI